MCLALVAVALAGCNGPFFVFAGGALAGEAAPIPASFAGFPAYGTTQLETNPADPYSVNVVYTVVGDRAYINAGDSETRWVRNIAADARVRARIDGALYEARAVRTQDAAEIASFAAAWTSQSRFRRDPTTLDEVWIYRLEPR